MPFDDAPAGTVPTDATSKRKPEVEGAGEAASLSGIKPPALKKEKLEIKNVVHKCNADQCCDAWQQWLQTYPRFQEQFANHSHFGFLDGDGYLSDHMDHEYAGGFLKFTDESGTMITVDVTAHGDDEEAKAFHNLAFVRMAPGNILNKITNDQGRWTKESQTLLHKILYAGISGNCSFSPAFLTSMVAVLEAVMSNPNLDAETVCNTGYIEYHKDGSYLESGWRTPLVEAIYSDQHEFVGALLVGGFAANHPLIQLPEPRSETWDFYQNKAQTDLANGREVVNDGGSFSEDEDEDEDEDEEEDESDEKDEEEKKKVEAAAAAATVVEAAENGPDRVEQATTQADTDEEEAASNGDRDRRTVKRALRASLPLVAGFNCPFIDTIQYPLGIALQKAINEKSAGNWPGSPLQDGAVPAASVLGAFIKKLHAYEPALVSMIQTFAGVQEENSLRSTIVHLLDAGACPNRPNLDEVTPFSMAVELGDSGLIRKMMLQGARPELLLEREMHVKLKALCPDDVRAEWRLLSSEERIQGYSDADTGALHVQQDTAPWVQARRSKEANDRRMTQECTVM